MHLTHISQCVCVDMTVHILLGLRSTVHTLIHIYGVVLRHKGNLASSYAV
jgi:hypothetical protein